MALMPGKLDDAPIAAKVTPAQAREAAEKVAGYESKLIRIEQRLTGIEGRFDPLTTGVAAIRWMARVNLALSAAILVRTLFA